MQSRVHSTLHRSIGNREVYHRSAVKMRGCARVCRTANYLIAANPSSRDTHSRLTCYCDASGGPRAAPHWPTVLVWFTSMRLTLTCMVQCYESSSEFEKQLWAISSVITVLYPLTPDTDVTRDAAASAEATPGAEQPGDPKPF